MSLVGHRIFHNCSYIYSWWNFNNSNNFDKINSDLTKLHQISDIPMGAWHSSVKALANGFNTCFNILAILLNGNVESVCHPPSTLLKRVERMLNRCRKSLKAFKICFNIHSTFLLFSKMFGMLKRSWSHLPRCFNIVEQAHAQLRRNLGHHGWKQDNFVCGLLSGLIFLSEEKLYSHQGLVYE